MIPPEPEAEVIRPPKPTGPHEYLWHNHRWCRARAGDGRLMPVDASGTFLRNMKNPGELARPEGIIREYWDHLSNAEKLEAIRRGKADAAPVQTSKGCTPSP